MDIDFILIQRIKKSDEKSSEIFVRKYYSQILKYSIYKIKNHEDAEDITQETFLKFFLSISRYKDYGKALNYLYVIARNLCKDYYKKNKNIYTEDLSVCEHLLQTEDEKDNDLKIDIERAMDTLPKDLKEVAILFFFQELKQKEISKILGINLSLVKYRVSRVKKILSEYFKEED